MLVVLGINIGMAQNGNRPGFHIRSRLEAMDKTIGFAVGLLHQALRPVGIAGKGHRHVIQEVEVFKRDGFERYAPASRFVRPSSHTGSW
jgi:hypothetical protein